MTQHCKKLKTGLRHTGRGLPHLETMIDPGQHPTFYQQPSYRCWKRKKIAMETDTEKEMTTETVTEIEKGNDN